MMQRHFGLAAALALVTGAALASGAHAQMPDDVAVGARAEIEGRAVAGSPILAKEVEIKRAPTGTDQVEGPIEKLDPQTRSLHVVGVRVVLQPTATLSDDQGQPLEFAGLRPGKRAEAKGRFSDGVFQASSLELEEPEPDAPDEVELEGTITEADRTSGTFRLLGLTVQITPRTKVELD